MTGIQMCKWAWDTPPKRYCNLMASPNDDLCATHRGHVDAQLRMFLTAYEKATSDD